MTPVLIAQNFFQEVHGFIFLYLTAQSRLYKRHRITESALKLTICTKYPVLFLYLLYESIVSRGCYEAKW